MATISIARKHALTQKKAKAVAEKIAKDLHKRFELDFAWNGNQIDFERPGVTGSMVVGKDKIALDVWYIQNATLWLDIKIFVGTALMLLFGERVNSRAIRRAWSDHDSHRRCLR